MDKAWSVLAVCGALLFGACDDTKCEDAKCSPSGDDAGVDAAPLGPPKGHRIYATVARDNEVVVIDDETHEVLSHIPVGRGPAILLATPNNEKLYVANWSQFVVSAIDVASEEVTQIKVKGRPYVIAMAPDGKHVYAGLQSNEIAVIDTESDEIVESIATPELPASLIVSADGKTLYVATLAGQLRAISAKSGETIHEPIQVGSVPAWITIAPDGSHVYTLNFLSDDVSVVETETFKAVERVSTGAGSAGIIGNVTPDGSLLYVTNHGTGDMVAIDTKTNEITQTIDIGARPVGVQFDPSGERVYTTDFGPESLERPADMQFLLTGTFSTSDPGRVRVFDVASGDPIGDPIVVGPGATSVVVLPYY